MRRKAAAKSIGRWLARLSIAGLALGVAFACGPLLGIDDVSYGELDGSGTDGASDGSAPGKDSGADVSLVCTKPGEVPCGNECVDLSNTSKHCGKCNFDCSGPCSGSKCLDQRFSTTPLVDCQGIAVDGAYIYVALTVFASQSGGSIMRIPLDAGGGEAGIAEPLAVNVAQPSFIIVHEGRLYWTTLNGVSSSLPDGGDVSSSTPLGFHFGLTGTDGGVYAVSPYFEPCQLMHWTSGTPAPSLVKSVQCARIVLQDGNDLYWSNFQQGASTALGVSRFSLTAADASATTLMPATKSWGIAKDANYIYATEDVSSGGTGGVWRIAKSDGAVAKLADGLQDPRVIVASDRWLYVGEFGGNAIRRIPIDGGAVETIGTGTRALGMTLVGGFLYWVDNGDSDVRRVRVE